jgi:hypothetical protein
MNLMGLKIRTINILNALNVEYFQDTVIAIELVEARSASGFSDVEAKANVMYLALMALLANQYYDNLSDPIQLLLAQIIFTDADTLSQAAIQSPNADIADMTDMLKPKSDAIADARRQLNVFFQFLQSIEYFRNIYESRNKNQKFTETNKSHRAFMQMATDVDMDEDEKTIVSKKTSIGTTGLACCIAVCIYGKTTQNKTALNVSHIATLTAEIIEELKSGLSEKYSLNSESLEVYLAGGCIGSLYNEVSLLMQTDLGIHDMRLGLSDVSLDEGSCIVIQGKYPNKIAYCFDQPILQKLIVSQPSQDSEEGKLSDFEISNESSSSSEASFEPHKNQHMNLFFKSNG